MHRNATLRLQYQKKCDFQYQKKKSTPFVSPEVSLRIQLIVFFSVSCNCSSLLCVSDTFTLLISVVHQFFLVLRNIFLVLRLKSQSYQDCEVLQDQCSTLLLWYSRQMTNWSHFFQIIPFVTILFIVCMTFRRNTQQIIMVSIDNIIMTQYCHLLTYNIEWCIVLAISLFVCFLLIDWCQEGPHTTDDSCHTLKDGDRCKKNLV